MWALFSSLLVLHACTTHVPDAEQGDPQISDSAADSGDAGGDTGGDTGGHSDDTGGHAHDTGGDTAPPAGDADADGYDADSQGGDDCDDTDPAVNPGATEVWYDGVDSDCSGGSDYDADGDGADSQAWGGDDCDDTDPAIQTGCPELDTLLGGYTFTAQGEIDEIGWNLSGITWNPDTASFMAVLDSSRTLFELDTDMSVLREISLSNVDYSDTEDIAYLGQEADGTPSYAIVTEEGVVYVGQVPDDDSTAIDLDDWQTLIYNPDDAGNSGGEGVAYDPDTRTFWVCKERSPMGVQTFTRPTTDADATYEDGSLVVSEAFDAATLLAGYVTDLSSCMFDPRTGRLLMLSQESDYVLDVATDGTVFGTLDVDDAGLSKPEGLTLTTDGGMVIVGEPNQWASYAYSGE